MVGAGGEEHHGRRGGGSSVAGVREGAAEVGRAPRRGRGESSTPLQHRRATSIDLVEGEWLHGSRQGGGDGRRIYERWGLPVGEDAGRWCAAAEDEERGRGKGGSGAKRDVQGLILFFF